MDVNITLPYHAMRFRYLVASFGPMHVSAWEAFQRNEKFEQNVYVNHHTVRYPMRNAHHTAAQFVFQGAESDFVFRDKALDDVRISFAFPCSCGL